MVQKGDRVPEFSAKDQLGNVITDQDLMGQITILYFYPKDDTPGCTKEACDFRDNHELFSNKKMRIIGVSPDKASSHQKFINKYKLNFTLLVDEDLKLCKAFGVWKEKLNFGIKSFGVQRSTFIIDEHGIVIYAKKGIKVEGHIQELLEVVK